MKPFAARTHQEMRDVLMDPEADGPEVHYYMIRGGSDKKNITVWETGLVGEEYIKTYGHYHVGDISETYTVLLGEGVLLMQTRKKDVEGRPIDDEIETFVAYRIKAGDSVFIPAEIGHLVVNTGPTWLVTSDDSPDNFGDHDPVSMPGHANYSAVKTMQGFAYYVVRKNGQPEFVKNPNYKTVPDITFKAAP